MTFEGHRLLDAAKEALAIAKGEVCPDSYRVHRTRPAASDRVLLVTVRSNPDAVLRALELAKS